MNGRKLFFHSSRLLGCLCVLIEAGHKDENKSNPNVGPRLHKAPTCVSRKNANTALNSITISLNIFLKEHIDKPDQQQN